MTVIWISRCLGVVRVAVGMTALVRPDRIVAGVGGPALVAADQRALARMFGIRDVALGALALSSQHAVRRAGLGLGVVADAGDAAALTIDRDERREAAGGTVAFAVASAVAGTVAIVAERRR
mgnify:CR=1 FL=1